MSARRKRDYRAEFRRLLALLPSSPAVTTVVADFEAALWRSVPHALGEQVVMHGCTFHWSQALWRKLQELGLAAAYMQHDSLHRYCRRLMALPFLPADSISAAFSAIKDRARAPKLQALVGYVDRTWITSKLWPPRAWSAYRQMVRTNNDVESWHARLNRRAVSSNLPFYKLIVLLHSEARQVALCANVLSDRRMQRIQSRKSSQIHQKLMLLVRAQRWQRV